MAVPITKSKAWVRRETSTYFSLNSYCASRILGFTCGTAESWKVGAQNYGSVITKILAEEAEVKDASEWSDRATECGGANAIQESLVSTAMLSSFSAEMMIRLLASDTYELRNREPCPSICLI